MRVPAGILAMMFVIGCRVCSAGELHVVTEIQGLSDEVSSICGRRLRSIPKLIVADSTEFYKQLQATTRSFAEGPPATRMDVGWFFEPAGGTIWHRRGYEGDAALAETGNEVHEAQRLAIVHELAHAWQHQHIADDLLTPRKNRVVTQALLEGHADHVMFCYASRSKARIDLFRRLMQRREGARGIPRSRGESDSYFEHVEAFRFCDYLARHAPARSIHDVFAQLPTEREVVYPREYLNSTRRLRLDLDWLQAMIAERSDVQLDSDDIGFVAFRRYIHRVGGSGAAYQRLVNQYLNGSRYRHGGQQLTALAFESEEGATDMFRLAHSDLLTRGSRLNLPGRLPLEPRLRVAGYSAMDSRAKTHLLIVLIADGQLVFEVTVSGGEDNDRAVERVVSKYRNLQAARRQRNE